MRRPTFARVYLDRIEHNARFCQTRVGDGFFCPMVKDNAYGHGAVRVVETLLRTGVRNVGVISFDEAVELRERFSELEILVFSRLTPETARLSSDLNLTPVLSTFEDLELLQGKAHIKIDTGLHRMGFDLKQIEQLAGRIHGHRITGVATHLKEGADAGDLGGVSEKQIHRFWEAFEKLGRPGVPHVLNSDALFARKKDVEQLGARPGLAIYGLIDSPNLKPAMELHSQLDMVRQIDAGESVSYGGRWTASKPSWIGVVPVGYGDGYHRLLSNRARMLFRGRHVPVVGSVAMDYSLLDLTDVCSQRPPELGERVVAFGSDMQSQVSVMELAELAETIPYELVTGLHPRIPRVYE